MVGVKCRMVGCDGMMTGFFCPECGIPRAAAGKFGIFIYSLTFVLVFD